MENLGCDSLKVDYEKALDEILRFIEKTVADAGALGVVVGLSGGVDSTLTAALCTRALGKEKVLGVLMPTSFTPNLDIDDAVELAKLLGIRTERADIEGIINSFKKILNLKEDPSANKIPLANIRARVRAAVLYYFANADHLLVAGTGDRSESLIGFFTKHGDGAADFFPISHLYKTQVRELAKFLGLPERMAMKPSSPQLYPGHKLSDEVPLDYDKLDPVLVGLFDLEMPPEMVSQKTKVPLDVVNEIIRRHKKSEHKRNPPLVIKK
jgi:NAD+ synthase